MLPGFRGKPPRILLHTPRRRATGKAIRFARFAMRAKLSSRWNSRNRSGRSRPGSRSCSTSARYAWAAGLLLRGRRYRVRECGPLQQLLVVPRDDRILRAPVDAAGLAHVEPAEAAADRDVGERAAAA